MPRGAKPAYTSTLEGQKPCYANQQVNGSAGGGKTMQNFSYGEQCSPSGICLTQGYGNSALACENIQFEQVAAIRIKKLRLLLSGAKLREIFGGWGWTAQFIGNTTSTSTIDVLQICRQVTCLGGAAPLPPHAL